MNPCSWEKPPLRGLEFTPRDRYSERNHAGTADSGDDTGRVQYASHVRTAGLTFKNDKIPRAEKSQDTPQYQSGTSPSGVPWHTGGRLGAACQVFTAYIMALSQASSGRVELSGRLPGAGQRQADLQKNDGSCACCQPYTGQASDYTNLTRGENGSWSVVMKVTSSEATVCPPPLPLPFHASSVKIFPNIGTASKSRPHEFPKYPCTADVTVGYRSDVDMRSLIDRWFENERPFTESRFLMADSG
ncbi:hypothetical protein Bbelb_014090 [Branchiostoma belcheri]|nr:hypothetical protein Bbelb_014090 [Branchiostoma belcheri]